MKRTGMFVGLLVWASMVKAATYYVSDCRAGADPSCVAGEDTNDGLSQTDDGLGHGPWQTAEKALNSVQSNTPAGTTYLFARGGVFSKTSSSDMASYSSTRNNPIVFDAYTPSWASASSNPPIVNAAAGVMIFRFENSGNAKHDEGYVVRNLDLRGGGVAQFGIAQYNDVDYVTMENLRIDGFAAGVIVGDGHTPDPGSDISNDNWIVRNSTITNNSGMGVLGMGSNFIIENNVFDNNGFAQAVFNHNIYITAQVMTSNSVIRNNILTHSAMVSGMCQGVSLVVHGATQGLLIENNIIKEDVGAATGGCWGISLDIGGYTDPEGFQGSIIRGNRVENAGGLGIGAMDCPDCVIENNVIVNEHASWFTGISVSPKTRASKDVPDNHMTIRNNSIYISAAAWGSTGIHMGTEGNNHVVVSNAIVYMSTGPSGGFSCFDTTGLTASAFAAFDNNFCYFPNVPSGVWEKNAGSLANWQANGMDMNSHQADPQFISPGSPNYFLAVPSGSPAVNAGNVMYSSTMDKTGQPRDALPDIGAYEYVVGGAVPPAAPTNLSATAVSSTSVNLTWTASPGAVTSYRIYRGIVWVGSSATTSFPDTNLTPSTIYSYSVEAVGGNGLLSNQSVAASATTQAGSVAPTGTGTADPTPGLREAYAFPNPAKGVDPVIRAKLGLVDAVEITIFDAAGRAVHSATVDGGSATIVNGEYCYDYAWTGNKASGIYYAVIHGKAGGKVFKARAAFAVVR